MPIPTIAQLNNVSLDAQHIADVAISTAPTAINRIGGVHKTLAGFQIDMDAVIKGSGYNPPIPYAAGIAMISPSTTVSYNGVVYAPEPSKLPFTTGAIFDPTFFRVIQGVVGADLAADNGAALIGNGGQTLQSVLRDNSLRVIGNKSLISTVDVAFYKNVLTMGYWSAGDRGGSQYTYDPLSTATVDYGSVFPALGGVGRWLLLVGNMVGSREFGCKGDARYKSGTSYYSNVGLTIPATDDGDSLNRWLLFLLSSGTVSTDQSVGYFQRGSHFTTKTLLVSVQDFLPSMRTDGPEQVKVVGSVSPIVKFEASAGSGQLPLTKWEGIKLDGISKTASNEGVRNEGLCFFTLSNWHFDNVQYCARPYNFKSGSFTEGWEFDEPYMSQNCGTFVRFSKSAGDASFNGFAFKNAKFNVGGSAGSVVIVDSGCSPYFSVFNCMIWNYKDNAVFIENNSTQFPCEVQIKTETQKRSDQTAIQARNNKLILCSPGVVYSCPETIKAWNYNSGGVTRGGMYKATETANMPDLGQMFAPAPRTGFKIQPTTGTPFKIGYEPGVSRTYLGDGAIIVICVTAAGYFWRGVYSVAKGVTDNIVNAVLIESAMPTNTAGYGAMVVSQGTNYDITVSNTNLVAGARLTWSVVSLNGVITV